MKSICAVLLFCSSVFTLHANEGFWPLHNIPVEKIKTEFGVTLTPEWITRAAHGSAMLRMPNSGGSGALVSHDGLLLTNRHVVIEYLGTLSSPGHNFVKEGFLAAKPENELRCPNLKVRVLITQEKLGEKQTESLKAAANAADLRAEARLRRQIEQNQQATRGTPCEVVGLYGGSEYWLYVYHEYTDVRLVYTPDEGLGDFGGREDNFVYPRHEIDIAFLRLYEDGKPAQVEDYLHWSDRSVAENEAVFCIGHPAENERDAPLSYMRYLCGSKFPAQIAIFDATIQTLKARMQAGDADLGRLEADIHRTDNRFKLSSRQREILSTPDVVARMEARETELRKRLEASSAAKEILVTAYDDCAAACEKMKDQTAVVELTDFRGLRVSNAWEALNNFGDRAENLEGEQLARITHSIQTYLREGPLSPSFNAAVEESHLIGHMIAAEKLLPAEHPLRKVLMDGKTPQEAARRILRESKLANAEGCCELVKLGAKAVRESQDPALLFVRALRKYELDHAAELSAYAQQELARQGSVRAIRRARFADRGLADAPETNRTARLTAGIVSGYELNGVHMPWHTTFRSQLEMAAAKKDVFPYASSPLLKNAPKETDLDTPLDFVMTSDGGPGCSGSPVLDKDGHVIGIMFDGNNVRVATLYYYAPPETGARSIVIHSAAIPFGLKLAGATDLLKELQTGAR